MLETWNAENEKEFDERRCSVNGEIVGDFRT